MIQRIWAQTPQGTVEVTFRHNPQAIQCPGLLPEGTQALHVEWQTPIAWVRTHRYTWTQAYPGWTAQLLSPKLMQLTSGQLIQASHSFGVWELVHPKYLIWHFEGPMATPTTVFDAQGIPHRTYLPHGYTLCDLALCLPQQGLEFSRSPHGFQAVVCFTDHCDFDTDINMHTQFALLQQYQLKVTKGFFFDNYAKRPDTLNVINHPQWPALYAQAGHECAWHSLSLSLLDTPKALQAFKAFQSPLKVTTYIDHGHQPYNWSQQALDWSAKASAYAQKGWKYLWHYRDIGPIGTQFNQLEVSAWSFRQWLSWKQLLRPVGWSQAIHFYRMHGASPNDYDRMGRWVQQVKSFFGHTHNNQQSKLSLWHIFQYLMRMLGLIWRFRLQVPEAVRGQAVVYRICVDQHRFHMFQTVLWNDWVLPLQPKSWQRFVSDNGVVIAHTYMSVPFAHYPNRLLLNPLEPNPKVLDGLRRLQQSIQNGQCWNPTLSEAMDYWKIIEDNVFYVDASGCLQASQTGLCSRPVQPR